MGAAVAVKSEEKKKKAPAPAPETCDCKEKETAIGAPAGMPLFLRSASGCSSGCGCGTCGTTEPAKPAGQPAEELKTHHAAVETAHAPVHEMPKQPAPSVHPIPGEDSASHLGPHTVERIKPPLEAEHHAPKEGDAGLLQHKPEKAEERKPAPGKTPAVRRQGKAGPAPAEERHPKQDHPILRQTLKELQPGRAGKLAAQMQPGQAGKLATESPAQRSLTAQAPAQSGLMPRETKSLVAESASQKPPAPEPKTGSTTQAAPQTADKGAFPAEEPAHAQAGAEPAGTAGPQDASAAAPGAGGAAALQAVAAAQAQLINRDSLESETQISRIATARRQSITGQFGSIRRGLSGLLAQASAGVQSFVAGKQAEVNAVSSSILKSAQGLVNSTMQAAEAAVDGARANIDSFVAGVTAALQSQVQGIASKITGVIDTIPIPNVPGIAQLRAAASGLVSRAAGMVTEGLTTVRTLITSAVDAGAQLLKSILDNARQLANAALAQVAAGIQRGAQVLLQALGSIANGIISALRAVLNGVVLPLLDSLQARILGALEKAQQDAVSAIRRNREQHLEALATALKPQTGGAKAAAGATCKAATAGGGAAALREIAREALANDRQIVRTFEQRTGSILWSIINTIISGAARIVHQVVGSIAQAIRAVIAKVQSIIGIIGQLVDAVGSVMRSLLQGISDGITRVIESVRGMVQKPIDQLLDFARNALSRIVSFVGRFFSNLLSGNISVPSLSDVIGAFLPAAGGPITKPKPPGGPITIPGLRTIFLFFFVVGAIILFVAPELAVIVTALMALGLSQAAAVIVLGALAILVLILVLIALYLLYKWITKPAPPKPKPPECITSLTVATSPGARTRTTIGVGEQVFLTHSPGAAAWSATAGTVGPSPSTIALFTAPDTAQSVVVTGGTATITFTVLAPSDVHMDRFPGTGVIHNRTPGSINRPDSGIATQPFILPDNVNFHRVQYRELNVGAVANGVYSCHGGGGVGHCKQPAGGPCPDLDLTDTVVAGKGTKAVGGDCVYSGDCPAASAPYTPGSLSFAIPHEYRVRPGSYRHFRTKDQVSTLASDGTSLTSDKAGAHGATTVSAGTVTIPGC